MTKFSLATTAIYLVLASSAFADSNSFIITQASAGAGVPTATFTQSGNGALASIIQNGNNTITGVQVGTGGTKLNVDQQNPTNGAANTINYTGRGNSDTTVYQRASNGLFTATGAAGNTASIDMSGITTATSNILALDQVGFNNTAIVYDALASYVIAGSHDDLKIGQYSDSAVSGNQAQFINTGTGRDTLYLLQEGGNVANITVHSGSQGTTLQQTNTADNAAQANTVNLDLYGAHFDFTQNGTLNNLSANLHGSTVNMGLYGWQNGQGNQATVLQTTSNQDSATGSNILEQTGNNNIAVASQLGVTHNDKFTLIQNGIANNGTITQSGTSNIASLTQTGNVNVGTIVQSGTGVTALISQH